MKLHKVLALSAILAAGTSGYAAVTISGTAFLNAPGIAVGDIAVFLIDEANSNTPSAFSGIIEGESITSAATYGNGDFTVLSPTKSFSALSTFIRLDGTYSGIPLSGDVGTGDKVYAVVFSTSTGSALVGDTYTVWTDPTWVLPSDGFTVTYASNPTGTNFRQFTASSTPVFTGVVAAIPEPSAFAAFAGFAVLGLAASRRRRA